MTRALTKHDERGEQVDAARADPRDVAEFVEIAKRAERRTHRDDPLGEPLVKPEDANEGVGVCMVEVDRLWGRIVRIDDVMSPAWCMGPAMMMPPVRALRPMRRALAARGRRRRTRNGGVVLRRGARRPENDGASERQREPDSDEDALPHTVLCRGREY